MKKNKLQNIGFDDADQSEHEDQPVTMPLISALGGADLATADAANGLGQIDESRRVAAQSAVLIAIVVVIAGGVLFTMKMLKGEVTADASSKSMAKIDQALTKIKNPELLLTQDPQHPSNLQGLLDTSKILGQLTETFHDKIVPVSQLQKNPFSLPQAATADAPVDSDLGERRRNERITKLRQELDRMSLQSIMGSEQRAVAVIGGEFYRSGQQLGSFRILSIDKSQVILAPIDLERQPGDQPFVLRMQDEVRSARPF